MTMRKQAGQTKKNTTTAAHKTTRRSAGTKTAAKSTPSKKASANTGLISDLDCYLFGAGTHYEIYKKLGAHPMTYKGKRAFIWRMGTTCTGSPPGRRFQRLEPGSQSYDQSRTIRYLGVF